MSSEPTTREERDELRSWGIDRWGGIYNTAVRACDQVDALEAENEALRARLRQYEAGVFDVTDLYEDPTL